MNEQREQGEKDSRRGAKSALEEQREQERSDGEDEQRRNRGGAEE